MRFQTNLVGHKPKQIFALAWLQRIYSAQCLANRKCYTAICHLHAMAHYFVYCLNFNLTASNESHWFCGASHIVSGERHSIWYCPCCGCYFLSIGKTINYVIMSHSMSWKPFLRCIWSLKQNCFIIFRHFSLARTTDKFYRLLHIQHNYERLPRSIA